LVPHEPPAAYTLVVLAVVVFLKEGVFRVISHGGSELGSTALLGDAWHHRSDALTSAAAFVGISVALLGGPGYETADDWAALLACGIIAWNGWRLLRPALAELMDEVPNTSTEAAVREAASSVPGVLGIETCLVRKTGLAYLVDLHVEVDGDLTVREGHRIAHESKDAVMAAVPQVLDVLVHVEPVPPPERHAEGLTQPGTDDLPHRANGPKHNTHPAGGLSRLGLPPQATLAGYTGDVGLPVMATE
jgi:cation diffusion facilitator family transporter